MKNQSLILFPQDKCTCIYRNVIKVVWRVKGIIISHDISNRFCSEGGLTQVAFSCCFTEVFKKVADF